MLRYGWIDDVVLSLGYSKYARGGGDISSHITHCCGTCGRINISVWAGALCNIHILTLQSKLLAFIIQFIIWVLHLIHNKILGNLFLCVYYIYQLIWQNQKLSQERGRESGNEFSMSRPKSQSNSSHSYLKTDTKGSDKCVCEKKTGACVCVLEN